jgi:hypothetical protein
MKKRQRVMDLLDGQIPSEIFNLNLPRDFRRRPPLVPEASPLHDQGNVNKEQIQRTFGSITNATNPRSRSSVLREISVCGHISL